VSHRVEPAPPSGAGLAAHGETHTVSTLPLIPLGSFAVIPLDLNVFTTDLRFEDEAPYLLWSVDSDGYLP
jgi:hypothetical protein